jgi:hypothetical protein
MALRGDDQFYFILTSDGSMEMYPGNKTSSFQVSLTKPLDFGEDNWEVGLQSINYPYSWVNVGPAAGVRMKYYVDRKVGVEELVFPNWQCQSLKEIEKFIKEEIRMNCIRRREQDENKMSKLGIIIDELGRVKIGCDEPEFDIGMSDNLLSVLGLLGHPEMESLRLSSFERRQKYRDLIERFWNMKVDYNEKLIKKSVLECKDLMSFIFLTREFISFDRLVKEGSQIWGDFNLTASELTEIEELVQERLLSSYEKKEGEATNTARYERLKLTALFMIYMRAYVKEPRPSKVIKGILPGVLNPVERMYIYLNIIRPIDMNDNPLKLLKLVNTDGKRFKTTQEEFSNPTYLPVQKGLHNMLQVYIKNDRDEFVPFMSGTVVMTLHFRKTSNQRKNRGGYF